jgi:6-phosphogluconolactonase
MWPAKTLPSTAAAPRVPVDKTLEILKDPESVAKRAAELFLAAAAYLRPKAFTVALAGGKQQSLLYRVLSSECRDRVGWHKIQFFFGDERAVHQDHPDSNYRLALESLFRPLNISASQVHRMEGEMEDLTEAALRYTRELKPLVDGGAVPRLDLVLLGLGSDGHTASLFPRSAALKERDQWVVPLLDAPKPPPRRLTLTVPVLNAGRQVIFLVSGQEKAAAVREVLQGVAPPEEYPAKLIRPGPESLLWLVDQAAASSLR